MGKRLSGAGTPESAETKPCNLTGEGLLPASDSRQLETVGSRVPSVNTEKVHLRGGGGREEGALSGLVSLRAPGKGGLLMGEFGQSFF